MEKLEKSSKKLVSSFNKLFLKMLTDADFRDTKPGFIAQEYTRGFMVSCS